MLFLTIPLRAKHSLSIQENMRRSLSIVRGSLSLRASQTCMVSDQAASLNLPDVQLLPSLLSFTWTFFHEDLLFPPCPTSQHSSNSATFYPCRVFAPNFPSAWNILTTPLSSHPTALFTSWWYMNLDASSSLNSECSQLLRHLVWTCHVTTRCVLCLSSLPTVGSFWPGTCLTHFHIPIS